jgi:hypothetical protein
MSQHARAPLLPAPPCALDRARFCGCRSFCRKQAERLTADNPDRQRLARPAENGDCHARELAARNTVWLVGPVPRRQRQFRRQRLYLRQLEVIGREHGSSFCSCLRMRMRARRSLAIIETLTKARRPTTCSA